MPAIDRIENELTDIDNEGLADALVAVLVEIGSRGRQAGEAAIDAVSNAQISDRAVNLTEGIAQIEALFEQ